MSKFSSVIFLLFLIISAFTSCQKKEETIYPYLFEYLITGNANPVTILYTKESGVSDSIQVTLPYQIKLTRISGDFALIEVQKNKNAGTITVETLYRGLSKDKLSTSSEHGRVKVKAFSDGQLVSSDYQPDSWPCSTYNGNQLHTGPKGGCYYINSNSNKTYVDRSFCSCD